MINQKIWRKLDLQATESRQDLALETIQTKSGDILFRVAYSDPSGQKFAFCFEKLESAFDFITTNFRAYNS